MKLFYCILIVSLLSACTTMKKEPVEEFIVDLKSPNYQMGEIETQLKSLMGFGSFKKNTVKVLYFPSEDAVCLQYRLDMMTYHQFWHRDGRELFIEALAKYNEDYTARNLNRNAGRKGRKAYGTTEGYLIWQQFKFAVQAKGKMKMELGYTFSDKLPYFYLYQMEAEYIDKEVRAHNRTSSRIPFLFTRAQAAEVAALFDQNAIDSFILQNRESNSPALNTDPNVDYY
ncbi:MAG: hypothetical protein FWB86_03140 [Treponema sp.]|nr:hypothetical protein [Treponema sp.]MCL2251101.1 hypothetical protein [Treponema sp.]